MRDRRATAVQEPTTSTPAPRFASKSRSTCQMLCSQIDSGVSVSGVQLLALATATLAEMRAGIDQKELTEILHFLLGVRAPFDRKQTAAFGKAVEEIGGSVSRHLENSGQPVWSPFEGRPITGCQLKSRFFQEALRAGQVDASLAFV